MAGHVAVGADMCELAMRPVASVRVPRRPATSVRVCPPSGRKCPHSQVVRSGSSSFASSSPTSVLARLGPPVHAAVPIRERSDGCALVEDNMNRQNLGVRLARARDRHLGPRLKDGVNLSPVDDDARELVSWLFVGVRRQLAAVIRQGAGPAEVIVGTGPAGSLKRLKALELLTQSSGPVQWPLAIECSTHPFHCEWVELKKWASGEGLFLRGRTELDPVYSRCVYLVTAWPANM